MNKNQSKKQEPTQKKEEQVVLDDFFTQFIEKRKKYLAQKLEEIAQLEKTSDLKPDQKEKVNNKVQTLEKIKYFDDIRALYFEAAAKKGKVTPSVNVIPAEVNEILIDEIVDVLTVGKLLNSNKKIADSLNFESAQKIADVYGIITGENSLKNNLVIKKQLSELVHDKKIKESVNLVLKNEVTNETQKQNGQKKTLFHESSDEEIKAVKSTKKQTHTQHISEKHASSNFKLVQLPEKEEVIVEEFIKLEKVYKHPRGPKKPYTRGPSDFIKKNQEGEEQGNLQGEENQENSGQQRGGYKGKRFDPNFKKQDGPVKVGGEKTQELKPTEGKTELAKQE